MLPRKPIGTELWRTACFQAKAWHIGRSTRAIQEPLSKPHGADPGCVMSELLVFHAVDLEDRLQLTTHQKTARAGFIAGADLFGGRVIEVGDVAAESPVLGTAKEVIEAKCILLAAALWALDE